MPADPALRAEAILRRIAGRAAEVQLLPGAPPLATAHSPAQLDALRAVVAGGRGALVVGGPHSVWIGDVQHTYFTLTADAEVLGLCMPAGRDDDGAALEFHRWPRHLSGAVEGVADLAFISTTDADISSGPQTD